MRESEEEITAILAREIRIITGGAAQIDPSKSLKENGINSMSFMELLLAVESRWHISLTSCGIRAADTASLHALAHRIRQEGDKA